MLDISGKKIPIFPVDPKFKDRETLRLLFPSEYRHQVRTLLHSLKPTTPPTAQEILEEAAKIAASLAPEKTTQPSGTITPPGFGSRVLPRTTGGERDYERYRRRREFGIERRMPERLERRGALGERHQPVPGIIPGRTPAGKSSLLGTKTIPPDAQNLAIQKLKGEKAQKGWIYADEQSMFEADLSDAKRYDDAELFMKQVSLWVQEDIIDAINRTNEQAHREAAKIAVGNVGNVQGVPASAVKRLISINVRGFVVAGTSTSSGGSMREGYRLGAEGGERFGAPTGSQEATGVSLEYLCPGGNVVFSVPELTGRYCNKLFDVVHYDFTVVMPMRYLMRLYRNLMMENFHTILDVKIENPYLASIVGVQARRAGMVQDQLYYYGNESVMQVTIVGEMLLLTDWTRGRWNDENKQWDKDLPPLMPVGLLNLISQIDPSALREEDEARLKAASPEEVNPLRFGGSGGEGERRW